MNQQWIDVLQAMPIFGGIEAAVLEGLLEESPIITTKEGDYFFREGSPADCLYVLDKGHASVIKTWRGHGYVLHDFGPGDCFGEMALIDLRPRSAAIRASELCTAIQISRTSIFKLQDENLGQWALLMRNMAVELSRRLRDMDRRLFQKTMESKKISERVPGYKPFGVEKPE
ncbi:MAG: CRP/FNR family cyclic AMP-dependent transcriptional regulator [Rhodothermales bacterium]|jgi:CRP/FNR family cyclic AMP-dependent transcriptional regulator